MSSLAATQADGYYLPPEYFDSGQYKKQSKNQFAGSKGHNQFLQKGVVRFELPYKGICGKCQESIGRGTRYNAHKVASGVYYLTTPIWEFQMTCRKCQHPWKIRTNPQQRGFDYVEGISIQAGQEDVVDMSTTATTRDEIVTSVDRLESVTRGERQTKTEMEQLQALQVLQKQTTLEDATWNASIRAHFRTDRKLKRLKKQQASKVGWRDGMEWLVTSVDDQVAAKSTIYGKAQEGERRRLASVRISSIFQSPATNKKLKRRRQDAVVPPDTVSSSLVGRSSSNNGGEESVRKDTTTTNHSLRIKKQTIQITAAGQVKAAANKQPQISQKKAAGTPNHGMQDMLAAYGSSDSENDDDDDID